MRSTLLVMSVVMGGAGVAADAASGIERLAWLQGCWESVSGDRVVEEHWTAPRAGSMLEIGRTMRGDALIEYEFVIVRERGDRLVYEAHPSSQPPAEFLSSTVSPNSVVFENAQHDFPQRVGYQRKGDALDGWIDGTVGGKSRRVDFHYRQTACPAN